MNDTPIVPVFIFSLPRTGSTLLQRLLAAHPDVSSTAEPWILLPILYGRREKGAIAEYGHRSQVRAFQDFLQHLPAAGEDVDEAIRMFASTLYEKASSDSSSYFIDKTPRYHLVAEDIMRIFGRRARYLFLWRNPLAIVASIVETWGGGRWKFNAYYVDLFDGLAALTETYSRNAMSVHSVNYESLVSDPVGELAACLQHIGLDPTDDLVDRLSSSRLRGRMGDPTGVQRYGSISTEPLHAWKTVLAGPYRRTWSRRYLSWIGRERLTTMGYDMDDLLNELSTTPKWRLRPSDPWYHVMGLGKRSIKNFFLSRAG